MSKECRICGDPKKEERFVCGQCCAGLHQDLNHIFEKGPLSFVRKSAKTFKEHALAWWKRRSATDTSGLGQQAETTGETT